MFRTKIAAAAAVAALGAIPASAQQVGEARLYVRGNFAGSAIPVAGPQQGIGPVTVKSVQIPAGSIWELCSGSTFTGCKSFSESDRSMVMTVRSVRPVPPAIPERAAVAFQGVVQGSGPSLRGLASEYFVMPDVGGTRVDASSGESSRAAVDFCRSKGWRTSAHERVQTVGGRPLLADVLCVNDER